MTPNELTTWLHGPLAERLVLTLAHFLWQGSLVAGAVLLGSLIAGSSTRRRYAISVIGLVALLLSPLATFFLLAPEAAPTATTSLPPAPTTGKFLEFNAVAPAYEDDLAHSESRGLLSQLSPWIFAAWMLGVAVFSTRLLLGIVSIGWLKNSGEVAGEMLRQQARMLSAKLRIRTPAVRVSRQVTQALAVGFFRPVIVVPTAWLIQLPPDCLEAVLAHELAHIRRRDLWINLLQRIVETFLFFHPAVWWLSARLRQEREMCCDELAVSLTGRRVEYASTLELVARRRGATGAPALAAGLGGRKMALLNRVRNILGLAPSNAGVGAWTLGAGALVAGAGVWWLATGGSPMSVFAGEEDESSLVALLDDEEGEREERGERERDREEGERRDGDREREGERERERERGERDREDGERERDGDREQEREGDRERDGERERPRDGDREREGRERDRPREGDREGERDRPSPEQFRRHSEEGKGRSGAVSEEGRRGEAERVEHHIRELIQQFERGHRPDGEHREGEHREGNRPSPDVHPEVREHLENLHRRMREAAEAGRADEAHELERAIHAVHERIRAQRERQGDRPRPEGERDRPRFEGDRPRPDFAPRDRELIEVIQALREEVGRLRAEVNELKGDGERDRPRYDREGDRPRFEAHPPRPRLHGDRRAGDQRRRSRTW